MLAPLPIVRAEHVGARRMLAENRVPSPSRSPQHIAISGHGHHICTGTCTTPKTDGPMDGLRALAATTNKTVNNDVNNEPDLPVGQVTVAGVFFGGKQFQAKKKASNLLSKTNSSMQQASLG